MKNLLSFEDIKKVNRDGDFLAVCDDGKEYEASYSSKFQVMFFIIPQEVKILGYVENDILKRYKEAVNKIGCDGLLNLPEQIKELLKSTRDLKTKTELLEEMAKNI